jgi:raffinose/stachyose/melibiose transport system permease protein
MKEKNIGIFLLEIILIIIALAFIYPIVLIFYNSFKSFSEILLNVVTLPKTLFLGNYTDVWRLLNYPRIFMNTLIVTSLSTAGIVLIGSMAGYKLSRTKTRVSSLIFTLCMAPMMVPFQTTMITLVQESKLLHLTGNLQGLSILYWGINAPFAMFLFHGYVKSLPKELDESASIDGCSALRLFFNIIFPIMKPLTVTIVVINFTQIWNDFLLPLLMISTNEKTKTLQVAAYSFFGQYIQQWNLALAAVVMTVTPSVIFFLLLQKHIIKGVAAGAVKG